MDDAYEKAQRRREEIRKELEEIDLFLRLHQKFSAGTVVELSTPGSVSKEAPAAGAAAINTKPKRNLSKAVMAETVREFMLDRKRPMTRTDIVEALELKGIPVVGVDKSKAIGTIMWRLRDSFVNIPGYGYWPIDFDNEAVGYRVGDTPRQNPTNHDMFSK